MRNSCHKKTKNRKSSFILRVDVLSMGGLVGFFANRGGVFFERNSWGWGVFVAGHPVYVYNNRFR